MRRHAGEHDGSNILGRGLASRGIERGEVFQEDQCRRILLDCTECVRRNAIWTQTDWVMRTLERLEAIGEEDMQLSRQQRAALNAAALNRTYMARTGLTYSGQRLWTAEEIGKLRCLYPDYAALVAALPSRTRAAIASKVRSMGLARPLRVWSEAEFRMMKPLYLRGVPVSEMLERLPGKTARQVWSKASHHEIRRPRLPPCLTGSKLVDAVRRRAFDLNMSMADLDAMAGKRFRARSSERTDWGAVQRVLPHLGGRAVVRWNDG